MSVPLVALVLLVLSVPVLSHSADLFVVNASRTALHYKLSPVLVGALLVGLGTSLPEALASVVAAAKGATDVAVGNIVGSNVANLTLVLGMAALLCAVHFPPTVLRREVTWALGSTVLLAATLVDGHLGRVEGSMLLAVLLAVVYSMLRSSRSGSPELEREVLELVDGDTERPVWGGLLLGLLGVVGGAYMLVWSALELADLLGLRGGLVGVTLVALGTSLPEMVTSYHAARRNEGELIVGNLLGSNIFNALLVGGLAALAGPGAVERDMAIGATWIMVGVTALVAGLAYTLKRMPKIVTPLLLAGYVTIAAVLAT